MSSIRYRSVWIAAVLLALSAVGYGQSGAGSPDIVISQVYGGGGNSGATYTHDFIELYNRGTAPISVNGWSVQYASAAGNFGTSASLLTPLSGTIQPGRYLLIQEAQGAGGTTPLPTPDVTDPTPIAMSATTAKVALVTNTTPLACGGATACTPAQMTSIRDLVGWGAGVTMAEGSAPAPGTSNTTAALRAQGGAQDTDHNATDFAVGAPTPRNSATGGEPVLSIGDVSIAEGDSGITDATFTISLSGAAGPSGVSFTVSAADVTAQAGPDYLAVTTDGSIPAGGTTASYTVQIVGDFTPEPDETFTVSVQNVTGASVGDGQATGTIRNDDLPAVTIHDIQGDGAASPYAGQIIATTGIVTGLKSNGFFVQTPDAEIDANPGTSQGIFVFQGSAPAVAIGDHVRVSGRIVEFRRASDALPDTLTEIGGTVGVAVLSSGNALPASIDAALFDASGSSRNLQLERYEGMLVRAASLKVVGPTNGFGEFYGVIPPTPRPFREPGIDVADTMPAEAPSPSTIPRFDGNFERIMVDSDEALSGPGGVRRSALQVATGATLSPIVGPLDYAFDEYRISLDYHEAIARTGGMAVIPAPVPAPSELTISSLNLLNFFPPNPANPGQVAAFNDRLTKASLTIRTVLQTPDILGLIEVGDINVLRQLRDRVNADAGTSYEAYLLESDDDAENDQDVGYLVNLARIEVAAAPYQVFRGDTFELCGVTDILFDRPPFVLEARFQDVPVTVILNHLRSLLDISNNTTPFRPAPCTETLGSRVREKRRLGAEALADLIESRQAENLVVLGDMNAFEFSDGYGDIVGTLQGEPAPAEQVVESSTDRWDHTLFNLAMQAPPDQRYSYVFQGSAQVLDHVLVNQAMLDRLTRFTYVRTNADFPAGSSADPTTTERLSDHDAPVAFFAQIANLTTTTDVPATVMAGSAFTYQVTVTNAGPDAAHAVVMTNVLPANAQYATVLSPAGWSCAAAGGELRCEAATLGPGSTAHFTVSLNAACAIRDGLAFTSSTTASSPAERESARGDNGSSDSGSYVNPAPLIGGAAVDPTVLWPPNGTLHPVRVSYSVSDNCGPVSIELAVRSSEGDANRATEPDWIVVSDDTVLLRAERSGQAKEGRVYTITITATDSAGGVTSEEVHVKVPHNR